jgi:hypothetical protein
MSDARGDRPGTRTPRRARPGLVDVARTGELLGTKPRTDSIFQLGRIAEEVGKVKVHDASLSVLAVPIAAVPMNVVVPPVARTPLSTSLRDWRAGAPTGSQFATRFSFSYWPFFALASALSTTALIPERPVVAAAGSPFLLAAHAAASEIDTMPERNLVRQRFQAWHHRGGASFKASMAWRDKSYPSDFIPEDILAPAVEEDREYRVWDSILNPRAGNALLCFPSKMQPTDFYHVLSPQGPLMDQLVATTVHETSPIFGEEQSDQTSLPTKRSNPISVCGQIRQILAPPVTNTIMCRSAAHLNVVQLAEAAGEWNQEADGWSDNEGWSDDDNDDDDSRSESASDFGSRSSSRRRKKRRRTPTMPTCTVSSSVPTQYLQIACQ